MPARDRPGIGSSACVTDKRGKLTVRAALKRGADSLGFHHDADHFSFTQRRNGVRVFTSGSVFADKTSSELNL